MTHEARPRYLIKAWRDWSMADPTYVGAMDTLAAVEYVLANLSEPLVDVIDRWADVPLIRTRRDLPYPAAWVARATASGLPAKDYTHAI